MKLKTLPKAKKQIINRLQKICSCCGRKIKVIFYKDKTYRGGHYFGRIPLHTKKALNQALKFGTHRAKIGNHEFNVLNKDPKPYAHAEHWECPSCYWRYKS